MKRVLSFAITVWMALAPNGIWADEGGGVADFAGRRCQSG